MPGVADWQKCEAVFHVGEDSDSTVQWRDIGLMCDVCYAAFGDARPLKAEVAQLRTALEAIRDGEGHPTRVWRIANEALDD